MEEDKQQKNQAHIAMIPSPGIGHLIPFIELAKLLLSQFNFSITLLLPCRAHDKPTKAQSSLLSSLPNAISYVYLPPIDLSHIATNDLDVIISLVVLDSVGSIKDSLSTLPGLVAVVTDLFGTPVFDVARKLGVPPYLYFTTNAMYLLFLFQLPKLHETVSCEFGDMIDPVIMPGCLPVHGKDFEDALQDRKSEAYSWILYHIERYGLVDGILINTFLDLEIGPIRALQTEDPSWPKIYPIGPIVRSSMDCDATGVECLRWLDQQPCGSVLFVSFGSGGTLCCEQLGELANGLEKSGLRFMWVVKGPNDQSSFGSYYEDEEQHGPFSFLPEGFVERTKDRGLLVSCWVPQIEVLSHKATGGFLSHCGWNSILESIVYGVPLIAWPLYAEQKMNANIVEKGLEVALKLELNEHGIVEADQIAEVVKELLLLGVNGSRIQIQMKELSNSAKKAITNNGDSAKAMKQVATKWMPRSKTHAM